MQNKEFAVLCEASTLFEYRAERHTSALGTRVKVGNMPIYLGSSTSTSQDVLKEISQGKLILTNKRLIFIGTKKNLVTNLTDILSIENRINTITLSSSSRQKPVVFNVGNGFLWHGATELLTQAKLETPTFATNVNFKIE